MIPISEAAIERDSPIVVREKSRFLDYEYLMMK